VATEPAGTEQRPGGWQSHQGPGPGGTGSGRLDYRLAAIVTAITIGTTLAWHGQHAARHLNPAGWALLALACAAMLLRRRYPAVILGVVAVCVAAYFALGNPAGMVFLPLTIALGGAILAGYRLLAWLSCPVVYAFVVFGPHYLGHADPAPTLSQAVTNAAWPLLILIGAEMVRAGRERAASMARGRAEHGRRQAEQARRRASEERVRIAQELHDVVAHNISLINVQAGVALHLMDSGGGQSPDQAREALAAIKQASKETLGELRSVLGILRAEPGQHAPLYPTTGLGHLDGLVAGAISAGLTVDTEITGERLPLPPSTDLAAYRIVQEALTNVIKHVGAASVTVRLRYTGTGLDIEITDDGGASAPGPGRLSSQGGSGRGGADSDGSAGGAGADIGDGDGLDGSGSGIPGMHERTRMLGGEFSAGPLPGAGFRVSATLPLPGSGTGTTTDTVTDGDTAPVSRASVTGPGGAA
jgi:signal transduction histidine kinase